MNIFWLHLLATINATFHMDKHVSKMITESLQLLYSALHLHCKRIQKDKPKLLEETPYFTLLQQDWEKLIEGIPDAHPSWETYRPYRLSHVGHPCLEWLLESKQNWMKLCDLTIELCKEYSRRYYGPLGDDDGNPSGAFTIIKKLKSCSGVAVANDRHFVRVTNDHPVKSHSGYAHALLLQAHVPDFPDVEGGTLPALCMPDAARDGFCQAPEFHQDTGALKMFRAKSWQDAVSAYQKYYHHKLSFMTFTNTSTPSFINPKEAPVRQDQMDWDEFVKIRDRQRNSFSKQVLKYRLLSKNSTISSISSTTPSTSHVLCEIYLFAAKACCVAKDLKAVQMIASNTKKAVQNVK